MEINLYSVKLPSTLAADTLWTMAFMIDGNYLTTCRALNLEFT